MKYFMLKYKYSETTFYTWGEILTSFGSWSKGFRSHDSSVFFLPCQKCEEHSKIFGNGQAFSLSSCQQASGCSVNK